LTSRFANRIAAIDMNEQSGVALAVAHHGGDVELVAGAARQMGVAKHVEVIDLELYRKLRQLAKAGLIQFDPSMVSAFRDKRLEEDAFISSPSKPCYYPAEAMTHWAFAESKRKAARMLFDAGLAMESGPALRSAIDNALKVLWIYEKGSACAETPIRSAELRVSSGLAEELSLKAVELAAQEHHPEASLKDGLNLIDRTASWLADASG
ncbi:MAG: hypothetical protein V2A34_12930, partial [Lentisphaerota bacterium]